MEKNIEEAIDKIKKDTQGIMEENLVEDIIKDNVIVFTHKNIKYRVTKPTFAQKQNIALKRQQKYIGLLKDPENLLEDDLIKIYEQRGIHIKEMDNKLHVLKARREDLSLKLGKAIADKSPEDEFKSFRDEIKNVIEEQNEIMMRKSILLDASIESQVNIFIYVSLAQLLIEKDVDGNWIQAWVSYDDLIKEEEELVNLAVWNATLIGRSELPSF